MNIEVNKERFKGLAKSFITREGVDGLLVMLEKSDFYTAPASTKYHNSYEGGLLEHSLAVFDELTLEVKQDNIDVDIESVAIVSLFHDLCKVGFYEVSSRNTKDEKGKWISVPYYTVNDKFPIGHSEKSIILLREFIDLSPDEMLAINAHMGGFDERTNVVSNCFSQSRLAVLLHIADLKATYEVSYDGEEK